MAKSRKQFNPLNKLERRGAIIQQRWIVLWLLLLMVLAGCSGQPTLQPTPLPTSAPAVETVRSSQRGDVVASGQIVPARKAALSFTLSGRVELVSVQIGDSVRVGDLLVVLETEIFAADLLQAEATLTSAQAQLEAAEAGPSLGDVAAAEGAALAAEGAVAAAQANLVQAEINAETAASQAGSSVDIAQAALAQAQGTLTVTNASLRAAESFLRVSSAQRDLVAEGAGEPEIVAARAEAAWAEMYWKQTRDAHDSAMTCFTLPSGDQICPGLGAYEEQARQALAASELNLAAAQAYLDRLLAGPEANALNAANANVSMAAAQRDAAQAQVSIAEAAVDAAEATLAQALAQDQTAIAQAALSAAQAQVQLAQGQLSQAKAQRDRLIAGATAQEIAQLKAGVAQAQAALTRAQRTLAQATLSAPFDGTVASLEINPGESVLPGQVVLTLAGPDDLQVETTDLSERDVIQVALGQPATVYVEALGVQVEGQVAHISPQATTIGGDVVYKVVVELNEQPSGLRWGMSVEVETASE